jgi:type II secretory pathway pseudopilin PulG
MKKSAGLRHTFTLLELIVVMSILFLASAMAVAVFRKESSSKRLESASLQWQNFCAGVRYRAVESGKMRQILFDPQERVFRMYDPETAKEEESDGTEKEEEDAGEDNSADPFPKRTKSSNDLQWKLPEDFSLGDFPGADEEPDVEDSFVLFTFYGDGSASGKRSLELRCGEDLGKVFSISALTGRLTVKDLGSDENAQEQN